MRAVTAILFVFSLFSLAFTVPSIPHYSRQFSGTQTGQATYYGVGLGACCITSSDSDSVTAISALIFDNYPGYSGVNSSTNPICGKQVEVTYLGNTVTVTIVDRCEACATTDLNLSPSAFQALTGSLSLGRVDITWVWL